MKQITGHIMMVRPAAFGFNEQTAVSNAFQNNSRLAEEVVAEQARTEFDAAVVRLRESGVHVHVIDDTPTPLTPDAIFPNNWISFHSSGEVCLYPMATPNRRAERRMDVVEDLRSTFNIEDVTDFSPAELNDRILEGTGSMILDRIHRKAYACVSPRTDKELFDKICDHLEYEPVSFESLDASGQQIYHTNVMMCIGPGFAVVCLASIADAAERQTVLSHLQGDGLRVVDITLDQVNHFAGNMLAVEGRDGEALLCMSQSAFDALTEAQRTELGTYSTLLPIAIPTIEGVGGGSMRCMMAEIFLPTRG